MFLVELYSRLRPSGCTVTWTSRLRTIRRQGEAEPTNPDKRLPDRLKQTDRGGNFVLHEDETLVCGWHVQGKKSELLFFRYITLF